MKTLGATITSVEFATTLVPSSMQTIGFRKTQWKKFMMICIVIIQDGGPIASCLITGIHKWCHSCQKANSGQGVTRWALSWNMNSLTFQELMTATFKNLMSSSEMHDCLNINSLPLTFLVFFIRYFKKCFHGTSNFICSFVSFWSLNACWDLSRSKNKTNAIEVLYVYFFSHCFLFLREKA